MRIDSRDTRYLAWLIGTGAAAAYTFALAYELASSPRWVGAGFWLAAIAWATWLAIVLWRQGHSRLWTGSMR